jgi:hypothetical protein
MKIISERAVPAAGAKAKYHGKGVVYRDKCYTQAFRIPQIKKYHKRETHPFASAWNWPRTIQPQPTRGRTP